MTCNRRSRLAVALLAIALAHVLIIPSATAQWVQCNGPYGGAVYALADNGAYLFAGTWGGGMYRSADDGVTWEKSNTGITWQDISCIASFGGRVFAGTSGGVFFSSNNGETWAMAPIGSSTSATLALTASGTGLFASTSEGVYRSTDNGDTWSEANAGLTGKWITCFAYHGSLLVAGSYASVYRSTDNGLSWTEADSGLSNSGVLSLASQGTSLFSGTYAGIFRSTNDGGTWVHVSAGFGISIATSFAVGGGDLYAGNPNQGVFRSTDDGESWTQVNAGLTNTIVRTLAFSGSHVFAGTSGGIFCLDTATQRWAKMDSGLMAATVTRFGVSGPELYVSSDFDGLWRSRDTGVHWELLHPFTSTAGDGGLLQDWTMAFEGTNIFLGSRSHLGVVRSTDAGKSWTVINSGLPKSGADSSMTWGISAIIVHDQKLFVTGSGCFRSSDWSSWNRLSSIPPVSTSAIAAIGPYLFVSVFETGVYRSSDGGDTWTTVNVGLPTYQYAGKAHVSPVRCFNVIPEGQDGVRILVALGPGGLYSSTNYGASWISGGVSEGCDFLATYGSTIFYAADSDLYMSTPAGWSRVSTNPGPGFIRSLAVVGTNLFAGTLGKSVWRLPLDGLVSVDPMTAEVPREMALQQNYPNPFNPSTSITYAVGSTSGQSPAAKRVRLVVYDLLGREVAVLADGDKVPGTYRAEFNGATQASGVYICRMRAGGSVSSIKMVLTK